MLHHTVPYPLGVSLHTVDPEQRIETIASLAGSPVKSVEIWEPAFSKDAGFIEEARRAFAAAGVAPRSVHAAFGAPLDISFPDPDIRAAGLTAIGVALDLAASLGAQMVIVHPSSEPIEPDDRALRMELSKRSLETIAGLARDAGCRIAIELLPRSCLGHSADELLELLGDIDPARAGVCLDVNHLMDRYAELPAVVHRLGSRLITLHCSDYDGVDEKHWPPLRGVIDWPAFVAALREVGYTGPLHYEAGLDGQTPAEKLAFLSQNYAELVKTSMEGRLR